MNKIVIPLFGSNSVACVCYCHRGSLSLKQFYVQDLRRISRKCIQSSVLVRSRGLIAWPQFVSTPRVLDSGSLAARVPHSVFLTHFHVLLENCCLLAPGLWFLTCFFLIYPVTMYTSAISHGLRPRNGPFSLTLSALGYSIILCLFPSN